MMPTLRPPPTWIVRPAIREDLLEAQLNTLDHQGYGIVTCLPAGQSPCGLYVTVIGRLKSRMRREHHGKATRRTAQASGHS